MIEADLTQSNMLLEDYSEWLGTLLRNPEASKDKDWVKKTAELQKIFKSGSRKAGKKDERKGNPTSEWVHFKDVMISADDLGEAEILFEAVEELKTKIDRLEKAKNSMIDLERYGLGKELLFVAFVRNGILERIVFKPKKETDVGKKFDFVAEFSAIVQK
jgi:hypothetical protein